MRWIVFILLISWSGLAAQYLPKYQGTVYKYNGAIYKFQDDDYPPNTNQNDTPEPDDTVFSDVGTYLFGPVDYSVEETGLLTRAEFDTILSHAGASEYMMGSNSWLGTVSSSKHPQIEEWTVDSFGTEITMKGMVLTMVDGFGNAKDSAEDVTYYLPMNYGARFNSSSIRAGLYFEVAYESSTGWLTAANGREYKLHGLIAGYESPLLQTEVAVGVGDADRVRAKSLGNQIDGSNHMRYVTYPAFEDQVYFIIENLRNPDDTTSIWTEDITDEKMQRHLMVITLNPVGSGGGLIEWFINGYKVFEFSEWNPTTNNPYVGDPIELRKSEFHINGVNFDYHWGGSTWEAPNGSDARLMYRNESVVEYDTDYWPLYDTWPWGVKILMPGDGGY